MEPDVLNGPGLDNFPFEGTGLIARREVVFVQPLLAQSFGQKKAPHHGCPDCLRRTGRFCRGHLRILGVPTREARADTALRRGVFVSLERGESLICASACLAEETACLLLPFRTFPWGVSLSSHAYVSFLFCVAAGCLELWQVEVESCSPILGGSSDH